MSLHIGYLASLILIGLICTNCQSDKNLARSPATPPSSHDAELAETLGADQFGMKSYVFVTLKTGPTQITDENHLKMLYDGHFKNIETLANEGKLVLAGPFIDADPKRGLYIFNVETIEDAQKLVLKDPAIIAGVFTPEFDKYYGSAALMKVNDIHATIQKESVTGDSDVP